MMRKQIFVVDDDVSIGNLLEELLTREGYEVARAYSGTEALMLLERRRPDLILLDRMLPGVQGEAVLERIRGIPVIVLSARTDVEEKVKLLQSGAVDYVTKPFDSRELLARIAVHLRAPLTSLDESVCRVGEYALDADSHGLCFRDQAVRLTKTEYAIMKLLMHNPGKVIAKSVILERISLDTPDCTDSSLKQHISNLRKKLRQAGSGDCIEAVWGIGFKFNG